MPPNEGSYPPLKLLPMRSRHENDLDVMNRNLPSLSKTDLLPPTASAGPYQAVQTDPPSLQVGPSASHGSNLSNTQSHRPNYIPFGGPQVPPVGLSRAALTSGYGSNLSDPQPRQLDNTPFSGPEVPPAGASRKAHTSKRSLRKAQIDAQIAHLRTIESVYYRYASGISIEEAAKLYNVHEDAVAKYFKELGPLSPRGHRRRTSAMVIAARDRRRRATNLGSLEGSDTLPENNAGAR